MSPLRVGLLSCLLLAIPRGWSLAQDVERQRRAELVSHPAAAGKEPAPDARRNAARVRRGMSPAEVRELLGPPNRIARQILYRRYLEQWTYDALPSSWIEFDCPRGQEPHVLTVHLKNPPPDTGFERTK